MLRPLLIGPFGLFMWLIVQVGPAFPQSGDTSAIKAANAAFYSAVSSRDISAIQRSWAPDEQISNIFGTSKNAVFGPAAVKADYEDLLRRFVEVSIVVTEPSVRQEGDVALVVGVETLQAKLSNGDLIKLFPPVTNIFVKRGGQWLMVHHHTSRPPQ